MSDETAHEYRVFSSQASQIHEALGEARVVIPKAKIDLKKLEEDLSKGAYPIPVEINKLPDGTARILYSKWLKPSA